MSYLPMLPLFGVTVIPPLLVGGGGATAGGERATEKVLETPFRLAVSVAVAPLVTAVAVAVKVALAAPAATVTDAGTVTFALLLESATAKPPAGAGAVSATEQLVVAGGVSEAELHVSPLSALVAAACEIETELPLPMTNAEVPVVETPMGELSRMDEKVLSVVGETVNVAVAITPLAIVLAFMPVSRQVYEPPVPAHESDLPAAVASGPAAT
jgi:hypothetical protein